GRVGFSPSRDARTVQRGWGSPPPFFCFGSSGFRAVKTLGKAASAGEGWGGRGGQANPPCSRIAHVTSGAWRAGGLTCSRVAHTGKRGGAAGLPVVLADPALRRDWLRAWAAGGLWVGSAGRPDTPPCPPGELRGGVVGFPLCFVM